MGQPSRPGGHTPAARNMDISWAAVFVRHGSACVRESPYTSPFVPPGPLSWSEGTWRRQHSDNHHGGWSPKRWTTSRETKGRRCWFPASWLTGTWCLLSKFYLDYGILHHFAMPI